MINLINNDAVVLDRTKTDRPRNITRDNIVTIPESAYQQLSDEVKNNGTTYLTYNDDDLTAGESIPALDDSLPPV
jgi:hypothetical protein